MALSGTMYTNVGKHWRLQLEWEATQNITTNQSTVTAYIYWWALDGYGAINSSATKTVGMNKNGTWSTTSGAGLAGLSAYQKKLIYSQTFTVNHNADGTGSVTLGGYFDAQVTLGGTYYDRINLTSKTFTLNTIPRKSTLTSSPNWTAGNTLGISINRASTSFTHTVKIYAGTTLIRQIDNVGTSSTVTFTTTENTSIFNVLNKGATVASKIELITYSGGTNIGMNTYNGTITAPNASTVTKATDLYRYINEDFPVSLNVSNTAFKHTVKWTFGTVTKTITDVGTSTNWNPSTAEETSLYNLIPNNSYISGTLQVTTYYNGVQVRTPITVNCEFHVDKTLNAPTFNSTDIAYADINAATLAITSDSTYIVQNKSTLRADVVISAVPKNGATLAKYIITINGKTSELTTATGSVTVGTITASTDQVLSVKAVDSRGCTTTVTKTVKVLPYEAPVIIAKAVRKNKFEAETTLSANGSYSRLTIAGIDKNNLPTLQYRYKDNALTTWGPWVNFTYTQNNGTFTATNVMLTLDNTKKWDIEVKAIDKLSTTVSNFTVGTGQPLLFIDTVKKSLGVNTFPQNTNSLELQGTINLYSRNGTDAIGKLYLDVGADRDVTHLYSGPTLSDGACINLYGNEDSMYPGQLRLYTGGTSSLTALPNGNVGINVNDPDVKLEVNGDMRVSNQSQGIMIPYVSNSATPAIKTEGSWITGGSDSVGLTKLNNVAIQTWWGFSVSPTISGQPVPQGVPAFSVNARNGDVYLAGQIQNEGYINASLQNGWVNYNAATYGGARYWKDKNGIVHISGLVKGGTTGTIFTLPLGYRPDNRLVFTSWDGDNLYACRIDVGADGSVFLPEGYDNSFVSLSGISFKAV